MDIWSYYIMHEVNSLPLGPRLEVHSVNKDGLRLSNMLTIAGM